MDDDDAGPRSLFAVVYYSYMDPPCYGLLQLDHEKVDQKARFGQPKELSFVQWLFSPPTSSTEDLYMVPSWDFVPSLDVSVLPSLKPFPGYKFNFRTGNFLPISPALPAEDHRCVVNWRGHIYHISYGHYTSRTLFQCYDPVKESWNALNCVGGTPHFRGPIVATAVWGDTILFNVNFCFIWAYYVSGNKWYPVHVSNRRCYDIVGDAVVLESTIYALAHRSFYSVLALSIDKEEGIDGDLVFQCNLHSENLVDVVEPIVFQNDDVVMRTRDLVHLGKEDFCLVQTCNLGAFDEHQPMQLTYIKLKSGNPVIVVSDCVYDLKIQHNESFEVVVCFSLPACNTTVLKESKIPVFDIYPYPEEDYASSPGQEEEIVTTVQEEEIVTPVQEEEIVTLHKDGLHATSELFLDNDSSQTNIIDEQGRSIYVRKLPPNATVRQLEKGLTEFGPIKRDGIRVGKNIKGKCFAYVEFESVTSKQRAIEASSIKIRGCQAEILEKR